MNTLTKPLNNANIYGPLELNGNFNTKSLDIDKKDTAEIVKYAVGNFDGYFRKKEVENVLEESIFTRKIKTRFRSC